MSGQDLRWLLPGGHPDTIAIGVSGGLEVAPRGRRQVKGCNLSAAEVQRRIDDGQRRPPGFTGVWGSHYYHRGVEADHKRYAGAFALDTKTQEPAAQ
jgi:hypothetical protein